MGSQYDWHDERLEEEFPKIIDSLGNDGARVISIKKTVKGYRFTECCDGHFGTTLDQEQMEKLIKELQVMAGIEI